jgi:phage shock protein A
MGSTQKMGTGTNVQQRLIALHHLDAPWRPADVEQREGRILRQGNQNQTVQVFRYVTEGSFDSYMWQTLETKARFIHQVMIGDTHIRHIEDIDARALTYAEVKAIASGNPLVIEKASVDAEITRFTRLRSQHAETQYRIRSSVRHLKDQMPIINKRIENLKLDIPRRQETRANAFEIQIEGTVYKDRAIAGELLNRIAHRMAGSSGEREVGTFAGFHLRLRASFLDRVDIVLKGNLLHTANVSDTPLGTIRSVEYAIQNMEERLEQSLRELSDCEKQCRELESKIGQPFEHEAKLQTLVQRQQELEKALDIPKNQAPNTLAADESSEVDVAQSKGIQQQSKQSHREPLRPAVNTSARH